MGSFRKIWVLIVLVAVLVPSLVPAALSDEAGDLAAARKLFEANLAAIVHRDRAAYLACYLESERFVRTGPEGPKLGFESLAKDPAEWPDFFEGQDLRLTPVQPGLVYGTYRYRVRYGEREVSGLSERLFIKRPEGWRIAVSTAFENTPGVPPPPRALVGATLLDGRGAAPIRDAVVVMRDGRIECAGARTACPIPEGIARTDMSGLWITPGLIDAHVHFSQSGWADARPDSLDVRDRHPYEEVQADLRTHPERFLRADLCSGVTSVFDVGGYSWTLDLPARAASEPLAPRVAAAGPLLSTIDFWVNLPGEQQFLFLEDEKAARAGVRYLASRGASAIKVWFIVTPDLDFDAKSEAVRVAGEEARQKKLPLIVHATGLREAKVALRAGARFLVHSVMDQPVDEEFLGLAKESGAVYCPTLIALSGYQRMWEAAAAGKSPAIDDPNGCVDAATRERVGETASVGLPDAIRSRWESRKGKSEELDRTMASNLKRVVEAGIPVAMGTDAGNPLTLHGPSVYAEMETMQAAGLSPMQVLVASTAGGARAMGLEKETGTVEAGKAADLLIVGADPSEDIANLRRVRFVVRGGVVRPIEELKAKAK